ncbi:EGF-like repeat and discoidin I-like domain-containing protein 3 isoform X2 [Stylophora pistillata]|uniref:EGF-like repeat and discoidin I-like domain-containing protein 3 isoform X2 n=1 Tax=Stylophora pistillata TaxID=50429 RepID=UPI000C04BEC9|nr:EGF-like repeat and discoidin I-like domain-containing protein 3 isoform X2 [Stylophora pistillata]
MLRKQWWFGKTKEPCRCLFLLFLVVRSNGEQECKVPLGMENGNIQDDQITASSQWNSVTHGVTRARLNLLPSSGAGGWVALQHTIHEWLQVDLRSRYTSVTGLATQGRNDHGQWVTKYNVQYSIDGVEFEYYKESGQSLRKEFSGNQDRDTVVYHELNPPITARYIRFRPLTWQGLVSMRVELYTCLQVCTAQAVGMETGEILDSQLSASSGVPSKARLNGVTTWCKHWPGNANESVYYQIDFGRPYRICAVATQGNNGGNYDYLKEYILRWSHDGVNWEESPEVLEGNSNAHEVKKNIISVIHARYFRLIPLKWSVWPCTKLEAYGEPWPEVSGALFEPRFGPGKALPGHVISSRSVTDVMQCIQLCLVTNQCKSINFSSQLKECEVSGSKSEIASIRERKGFHYYEVVSFQGIYI